MTYISSKERAKVIRAELLRNFGKGNVSVRKGSGTASSWVDAKVYGARPANCTCKFSDTYWNGTKAPKPYRTEPYCEACKQAHKEINARAEKIADEAMKKAGYKHSTYYADDGYDTQHSEFLLSVDIK